MTKPQPANLVAWIGAALIAFGMAVAAIREHDALDARVKVLESKEQYLHGTFTVPTKGPQ